MHQSDHDLPPLPVPPVRVGSSVTMQYGEDVVVFLADENDQGRPYILDRSGAETIAANILSTLLDMGVDIAGGDQ